MVMKNEKMEKEKITISPYRMIPCDMGHEIDDDLLKRIYNYFKNSKDWIVLSNGMDEGVLFVKAKINGELYLHLYPDGIGIFTIIDEEESYLTYNEYNPQLTMEKRKQAHRDILSHNHKFSNFIDNHIRGIRELFNKSLMRPSASFNWEKKGISYVMSFYFITVDPCIVSNEIFHKNLVVLLFPYYDERKNTDLLNDSYIETINEEFLNIARCNYEMLPYLHTCASWSNFVVVGRVHEKTKEEYWQLERELQHVWFYSYITDKFIEESLKNITTATPEKDLDRLDNILTQMIFKINKYESIINSTMHERDFRLYDALRKTSRLDLLVSSVEKKAGVLKDRYNWLLNEKRTRSDKKIEFILFLIAIITTIGVYETFAKIGLYSILIIILCIVLGLYFFKPFLYKRGGKD